jgi:hypothetical protein
MKHWKKAAVGAAAALAAFSMAAQARMGGGHMGGMGGGPHMGSFAHMNGGRMGGHIAMSRSGFRGARFAHDGFGRFHHRHGRNFFAFYPYPYYDDYYYDDDYDYSYCYWRHGRRFCRY